MHQNSLSGNNGSGVCSSAPVPESVKGAEKSADRHAVIRFKRDCSFPRFPMKSGERWGFAVGSKSEAWLKAIQAGERFDFAGGLCLAEDVEIIYDGPGNMEYSIAAGYVTDPDFIKRYRENPARFAVPI